jgi:hypothetical protein
MIAAPMPRCVHIYGSGIQCIDENIDPTEFCEAHQKVVAFQSERLEESWIRKSVMRVVALVVLLVMFLVPIYYTLKTLWARPVAAREGF